MVGATKDKQNVVGNAVYEIPENVDIGRWALAWKEVVHRTARSGVAARDPIPKCSKTLLQINIFARFQEMTHW